MRINQCRLSVVACAAFVMSLSAATATAQTIGTFRWQEQPYCNQVIITVTQVGGVYQLDGYDDQCGGGRRAPLVGTATPNPDGSIGFGLTIVTTPLGVPVHLDGRIELPSLNGGWRDHAG